MFAPVLPEPFAREARPEWDTLPNAVLRDIQKITGPVVHAEIAWGGFSPSACYRITAENGQKFFIKGSHPGQTAHGAAALRQEIQAYQTLGFLKEHAPQFHGAVSFGDEDSWRLGIWTQIEGQTALPWTLEKVDQVLDLLAALHLNVKREDVPNLVHGKESNHVSDFFLGKRKWKRFERYDDSNRQDRFCQIFQNPQQAENWLSTYLKDLVGYQSEVTQIIGREGVIHFDLRSDNILFEDATQKAVIIDWTDTCWGFVIFDLVLFSICVSGESDIAPQEIFQKYKEKTGEEFKAEDVRAVVTAICGYFADNVWRDVPAELPRLRWIQKLCLYAGLTWLANISEIPHPGKLVP